MLRKRGSSHIADDEVFGCGTFWVIVLLNQIFLPAVSQTALILEIGKERLPGARRARLLALAKENHTTIIAGPPSVL